MRVTLSGSQQRWLALALLALALVVLWVFVATPIWEAAARHEQRVGMLREQAVRLQALVDAAPRFAAAARNIAVNQDVRALAFESSQPSVAMADLQAAVNRIFASAGATVTSGETIAEWQGQGAGEIAVQATVEADIGALTRALHAIGEARPLMRVGRLSIREPDAEWAAAVPVGPQPNVANKLIVDIVVSASTRPAS
jgi:hypothetical protein